MDLLFAALAECDRLGGVEARHYSNLDFWDLSAFEYPKFCLGKGFDFLVEGLGLLEAEEVNLVVALRNVHDGAVEVGDDSEHSSDGNCGRSLIILAGLDDR